MGASPLSAALGFEQLSFAVYAPAIAGERAAGAHHAMARHTGPRDSRRRRGPPRESISEFPSPAPAGYKCAFRRAESAAAPATREAERPCRADRENRPWGGLREDPSPYATLSTAASTRRESDGSRRSSASGNSSRRLASASAARPASESQQRPRSVAPTIIHPNGEACGAIADALALAALSKTLRRHAQLVSFIGAARLELNPAS